MWPVSVPPSIWCEFYLGVWPVQCGLFLCLPVSGVSFTWECGLFSVACFRASPHLVSVLHGSVACFWASLYLVSVLFFRPASSQQEDKKNPQHSKKAKKSEFPSRPERSILSFFKT